MNPNFNRRQFIGLAVCVAVNTALTGCKKKEPEWTVAKDDTCIHKTILLPNHSAINLSN